MRVSVRKIKPQDSEFLFRLRNKPYVYKYSINDEKVSRAEHQNYIAKLISGQKPNTESFAIENNKIPIGQIRFNYEGKEAKISISLLKKFWRKGLGTKAFQLAKERTIKRKNIKKIIANVSAENKKSIIFFEKLNFKLAKKFTKKGKTWLNYILKV